MIDYPLTPAHTEECAEQIRAAVAALYRRATSILGAQLEGTPGFSADYLIEALRGNDVEAPESMAQLAAVQIVHDLLDTAATADPAFWGTALGRAIVWHVGWPGTHEVKIVPISVSCRVLGVTRQAAHQWGDTWSDGLRARLRERWEGGCMGTPQLRLVR